MLHFGTSQVGWLQEILLILAGMICLFLVSALIMAPGNRRGDIEESLTSLQDPPFDPRRNGRGTFYPWIPVA
jgi:hypothetical protein